LRFSRCAGVTSAICALQFVIETTVTAPPDSSLADRNARLEHLLARPAEQRLREYKYRFSQSVVFGLPVVALQLYGRTLGPADSERWVSLLQALLAGWVLYVNLGMLFEGILLLPATRRVSGDLAVASCAVALYAYSLISAAHGVVTSRLLYRPLMFHACVLVLATWTAVQWRRRRRKEPQMNADERR
jgi:cation transport ATPase